MFEIFSYYLLFLSFFSLFLFFASSWSWFCDLIHFQSVDVVTHQWRFRHGRSFMSKTRSWNERRRKKIVWMCAVFWKLSKLMSAPCHLEMFKPFFFACNSLIISSSTNMIIMLNSNYIRARLGRRENNNNRTWMNIK
jgi:hypothetical protein